ncbi:MAG: hypothetical protein ACRDHK_13310 [Actinomycetota bacterium]
MGVKAARNTDNIADTHERVKQLVANEGPGGFITSVLGKEPGLGL